MKIDPSHECVNFLGVGVNAINLERAAAQIKSRIEELERTYVVTCTVYTVMQCYYRPQIRGYINGADLVVPDGMPLVFLSRWMGYRHVGRVYGPDLFLALSADLGTRGYKHFYYGGQPGVPEKLAKTMVARNPRLQVVGTYAPPFSEIGAIEQQEVIDRINASGADIVWVALGSPKQDVWMARHRKLLKAPMMIGVGAAFDFQIGRIPQAPVWMQRTSLEWLFRLLAEPRRLWRRYLLYNPLFIWHIFLQLIHRSNPHH